MNTLYFQIIDKLKSLCWR